MHRDVNEPDMFKEQWEIECQSTSCLEGRGRSWNRKHGLRPTGKDIATPGQRVLTLAGGHQYPRTDPVETQVTSVQHDFRIAYSDVASDPLLLGPQAGLGLCHIANITRT